MVDADNPFTGQLSSDAVALPFLQDTFGQAFTSVWEKALGRNWWKSKQAQLARMPGLGDPSQLPLIGNDRVLTQGVNEPGASFVARLTRAFDDWAHAGNDWSVMQQVLAQILPSQPAIQVVDNTSQWSYYAAGSSTSVPPSEFTPFISLVDNWIWDTTFDAAPPGEAAWWRFWIIIDAASTPWCAVAPVFGAAGVTIGGSPLIAIGIQATFPVAVAFTAIRSGIQSRRAANAWCRWIVVAFDATLFNHDVPADGVHNPHDGFGRWSKIVSLQYVPSRFAAARYASGSPQT